MNDSTIDLSAPAEFRSSPGGEALDFDSVELALTYASSLSEMRRHPRAEIVISSSIRLGWPEIDRLVDLHRIGAGEKLPAPSNAPRSSRS